MYCVLCTALIRVHRNDRRLITLRWGLWGSSRLKTFNPLTKGGHEGQSDIENWKWQIQHCSSFSLIQFYGYISIWAHRRLRMYIFGVAVQPCTQRHTHSRTRKNTSPTSGSNYVCSRDLSPLGTPWQNRLLLVPGCYPLVTFQIERTIIYHFLTVWNGIAPNVPNHEYIYIIELILHIYKCIVYYRRPPSRSGPLVIVLLFRAIPGTQTPCPISPPDNCCIFPHDRLHHSIIYIWYLYLHFCLLFSTQVFSFQFM